MPAGLETLSVCRRSSPSGLLVFQSPNSKCLYKYYTHSAHGYNKIIIVKSIYAILMLHDYINSGKHSLILLPLSAKIIISTLFRRRLSAYALQQTFLRGFIMSTSEHLLDDSYKNALSEITTPQNELLDYARIDVIEPLAIIFIPFRPKFELMKLSFGTAVKINVFNSSQGFKALSGMVGTSTAEQLRISGLELLCASDRRQFVRIKTKARAEVTVLSTGTQKSMRPLPSTKVSIDDLSMGGAEISTPVEYSPDSYLLLKCDFYGSHFEFVCTIRRITKSMSGSFRYGCMFENVTPAQEESLHRVLLRLQQERRAIHRQ